LDRLEQILPLRIGRLDQIDLPRPFPSLERLLTDDRLGDSGVGLDKNEPVQLVVATKVGALSDAMLVNSRTDICSTPR
jgi:hypothetical protein